MQKIERITFGQAAKLVLAKYENDHEGGLVDVKRNLKHLRRFFGGMPLVTISGGDWLQYVCRRLEAGASKAAITSERDLLVLAFNLANVPAPHFDRAPRI